MTNKLSIKLTKSQIEILEAIQEGEILRIDNMNMLWLRDRAISSQTRYFFTENKLITRKDKRKAITTKGNGFMISGEGIDVLNQNKDRVSIAQQRTKVTKKRNYRVKLIKTCPGCKNELSSSMFVDFQGNKNPRGRYCIDCRKKKDQESREKHFNGILSSEIGFIKKYKIMSEDDWKSKAEPNAFFLTLFMERDFCPYCGKSFKEDQIRKDYFEIREKHQVDHMNPLNLGGEDSLKNVVCVCKICNLKKGKMPFKLWLDKLSPKYMSIAQKIYIQKHGYAPDQFIPSIQAPRNSGIRYELALEIEDVLEMKKDGQIY